MAPGSTHGSIDADEVPNIHEERVEEPSALPFPSLTQTETTEGINSSTSPGKRNL